MADDKALEARPEQSRRDRDELGRAITEWLAARPGLADVQVTEVVIPESNGMSSETVLVSATWAERGGSTTAAPAEHRLVFRVAPDPDSMPVFEHYDLEAQFRVINDVAALTDVPVPRAIWFEPDPARLGSPFFVMERYDGEVPPDVLPYNFGDNFLYDATVEDRGRLQRRSVELLAKLHAIPDPVENFPYIARATGVDAATTNADALRLHVAALRRHYEFVIADGRPSPLLEAAFAWIEEHWPYSDAPNSGGAERPVLLWGDARIGNVIYRDFEAVAVLDWEMATIGPRELDVSWMIFMHQFFEDVARQLGLPGMPEFMAREDVVAVYEELTGYRPRHLDFFTLLSALQHGIIMSRIGRRAVAFGASEMPADIDDLIMHRQLLRDYMA